MRDHANNVEAIEAIQKLEAIQKYVKSRFHPARGAFVLPHTSVPGCLASKALWAGNISWSGSKIDVSNTTHMICGIMAALFFGLGSLWGSVFGTNKLLKEIETNIANILNILSAMNSNSLSEDVICRLKQQIENIPTKPQQQPLSWNQMVQNVVFAWFTATLTSFTFSGAVRDVVKLETCVWNKPCSGANVALPIAATFAVLWGACALLLAHYGQREQAFLSQVNNQLKNLIANNSALSAEIDNTCSVAVSDERREKTSLLWRRDASLWRRDASSSSLQNLNLNREESTSAPSSSYTQPPPSPKKNNAALN